MLPLSMVQPGEQVEVMEIRGGNRVQQRLEAMGFVPGSSILMVTNQMEGPAIVSIKNSRVALGRGLMHHIVVRPQDGEHLSNQESPAAHGHHRHGFGKNTGRGFRRNRKGGFGHEHQHGKF